MSLDLTKHTKKTLFMTYGGGSATAENGWKVHFSANLGGSGMVLHVYDDKGEILAVYSLDAKALCQEAIRLTEEEIKEK